jgi:hypothetical protein
MAADGSGFTVTRTDNAAQSGSGRGSSPSPRGRGFTI